MTDYFLKNDEPLPPADSSAAIIVLEDGRYLMQARDDKPGILYPGHWGLFGGALNAGEDSMTGLRRELEEELGLRSVAPVHFTD